VAKYLKLLAEKNGYNWPSRLMFIVFKGLIFIYLLVAIACRGWLEEKKFINTFPLDKLLNILKNSMIWMKN